MATALGVLVAIQPWLAVATAATWLIIAVFFRYSSLASLVAAFFAPVYYVFGSGLAWYAQPAMGVALAVIAALLCLPVREQPVTPAEPRPASA